MSTKIDWCDDVWNPVWGCKRGCPYCYAKNRIAPQKGATEAEKNFELLWKENNYNKYFSSSAKRIFVNSMSDIEYWETSWWNRVIRRINDIEDKDFIMLTKGGLNVYAPYIKRLPDNCIIGLTITTREELLSIPGYLDGGRHRLLLNVEPVQGDIGSHIDNIVSGFDWVIIGAETSNNDGRTIVIPEFKWIESLYNICVNTHIPLFIKNNIAPIVPVVKHEYPKTAFEKRIMEKQG